MRKPSLKSRSKALDVLAHPLRLKILERLRSGPRCVCKIIPYVDARQSNVSHQLALLRKAGVVRCESRGPQVWYEVRDPRIFLIIDLLQSCVSGRLTKIQGRMLSRLKGRV